jgi:diadenosine tetraphosphate (Ap4A) HIT family hydrolase
MRSEENVMTKGPAFFQPPEDLIILRTPDWLLNHRVDSALPGYLMLGAAAGQAGLPDMPARGLARLGPLLAQVQRALETALAPRYLYIGRYGHSAGHAFHFHIIPVCDWVMRGLLADPRYRMLRSLQTAGPPGEPDGAELTLYIWREFCESAAPPQIFGATVEETVARLRVLLRDAGDGEAV